MTLRALSSGVAGLHANQTALDVIGNNIANLNTPGFKAARPLFADVLSQTIAGPLAPSASSGGRDGMQVGLGVSIAGVHPVFTQGAIQTTENPTDLAIQGDGFFVVSHGDQTFYTRAGAFSSPSFVLVMRSISGRSGCVSRTSGASASRSAVTMSRSTFAIGSERGP